jgi:phage tail-like protein
MDGRDGRDGRAATRAIGTHRFDASRTTQHRFDTSARTRFSRNGYRHDGVPTSASSRLYLRAGLPAIYQEGDFGLRFLGALETVLDPIVGILDSLHGHIDPDIAPRDMLEVVAWWLGLDTDEGWTDEQVRDVVRNGAELSRRRGTRKGLELQLAITFPQLPLRVEETGGVVWAAETSKLPAAGSNEASFVVYCDKPISESEAAGLARAIESMKPVHVHYRLRVKAPKKSEQEAKKQ